ncbi:hypothetical protein QBC39DRAFT_393789 [Podospora conica]|nr:hypothetical protein QBC39DRAFT_393789 [Schizothecium conicum]
MAQHQSQAILAPSDEPPRGEISVFLGGTTSRTNVTIYNPWRADWDSMQWREDVNFPPYYYAIVVCPEGYWKRGNVLMLCEKFDIEVVESIEGLKYAIVKRYSRGD